jgi:hypothetical protein
MYMFLLVTLFPSPASRLLPVSCGSGFGRVLGVWARLDKGLGLPISAILLSFNLHLHLYLRLLRRDLDSLGSKVVPHGNTLSLTLSGGQPIRVRGVGGTWSPPCPLIMLIHTLEFRSYDSIVSLLASRELGPVVTRNSLLRL